MYHMAGGYLVLILMVEGAPRTAAAFGGQAPKLMNYEIPVLSRGLSPRKGITYLRSISMRQRDSREFRPQRLDGGQEKCRGINWWARMDSYSRTRKVMDRQALCMPRGIGEAGARRDSSRLSGQSLGVCECNNLSAALGSREGRSARRGWRVVRAAQCGGARQIARAARREGSGDGRSEAAQQWWGRWRASSNVVEGGQTASAEEHASAQETG
ncbi:hypothetical protein BD779DRAFT_1478347 [Infundibulicybe gibba]|nr:hypothetical protein BD779DRAFT_1478347 [Infundibulicybe gibba]